MRQPRPSFNMEFLKGLYGALGDRTSAYKRVCDYYLYMTCGVSVYHIHLLNVKLNAFFQAPAETQRFFDLQEIENKLSLYLFSERSRQSLAQKKSISFKLNAIWKKNPDCPLSDEAYEKVRAIITHFSEKALKLLITIDTDHFGNIAEVLMALKKLMDDAHQQLKDVIPPDFFKVEEPQIKFMLESLLNCLRERDSLGDRLIGLAELRLSKKCLTKINQTLTLLPPTQHRHFFEALLTIETNKEMYELEESTLVICDTFQRHQTHSPELEDIPLFEQNSLPSLLKEAKEKYLKNGRLRFFHNKKYLAFCDQKKPTLPELVRLIVQQTGVFGTLHPDSFICIVLSLAQQKKCLGSFSPWLPNDTVDTTLLVQKEKPSWFKRIGCCFCHDSAAQQERRSVLTSFKRETLRA